MKARIYHNPACSKSRAALSLLREHDVEVEVVEYLRDPPSRPALTLLLRKLGVAAIDLVRTAEPEFEQHVARGGAQTEDALLDLLHAVPRLLQRPVVEIGERAKIGRPPEQILELLR